jgi:hypothetical protein
MLNIEFEKALASLGWSQADYSSRIGLYPEIVSDWVSGKQVVPNYVERDIKSCLAQAAE